MILSEPRTVWADYDKSKLWKICIACLVVLVLFLIALFIPLGIYISGDVDPELISIPCGVRPEKWFTTYLTPYGKLRDSEKIYWPWLVKIFYNRTKGTCNGVLISEDFVLTEATCIKPGTAKHPSHYSVALQILPNRFTWTQSKNRSTDGVGLGWDTHIEPIVRKEAVKIFIHDKFDKDNLLNNLALLRFDSPLSFTKLSDAEDQIFPEPNRICLPKMKYSSEEPSASSLQYPDGDLYQVDHYSSRIIETVSRITDENCTWSKKLSGTHFSVFCTTPIKANETTKPPLNVSLATSKFDDTTNVSLATFNDTTKEDKQAVKKTKYCHIGYSVFINAVEEGYNKWKSSKLGRWTLVGLRMNKCRAFTNIAYHLKWISDHMKTEALWKYVGPT